MNVISFNICGIGTVRKKIKINNLCNKLKINFLGIQESFATSVDIFKVREIWGNNHFDFASSSARGHSGNRYGGELETNCLY